MHKRQDQHRTKSLPSDEDYQRFAEQFIDAVLDPRQPWLVDYIWAYWFPPVPTWDQIESGALAAKMRQAIEGNFITPVWLGEALENRDRQMLVAVFKKTAKKRGLTRDELSRLLACGDFKMLKKSLKGLAEPFKFRPGPTRPSEQQYDEALKQAEVLVPALVKLLDQQSARTTRSVSEILHLLAKDFPDPCKFLLDNIHSVEACLEDPNLPKRAKTRTDARARVLADAISGSIHLKRKVTTAVQYLGIERRRRKRLKSSL